MTRAHILTIAAIITLCMLPARSVWAHPAWGIVIDRNNQIYFSDLETIWRIDAQGKLSVFRAGAGGTHTHDLNIDEAGNLYGAENSYEPSTQRFFSAVWRMTPAGSFSYLLTPTDDPPEGTSIWKDREGNMYHASNYPERELLVLKRTPSGNVTALVASSKPLREYRQGAPYSIGGMAFGPDGALYLTDSSNIRKITLDGRMTMLAGNIAVENRAESPMPDSAVTRLFGIAVDPQSNAFVADYGNRRVIKISPDGSLTTVVRAEQPWSPTGIALKDGNVYVLEFGFSPPSTYAPRVRKLAADGRITILATVGANSGPAAGEGPSGANSQPPSESRARMPFVLLGLAVGIFVLTFVIWRIRSRKVSAHQSS